MKLSDEAVENISAFLYSCIHEEGGFKDRSGKADPYYSVFGYILAYIFELDIPVRKQWDFVAKYKHRDEIDLVHAVSLVQCSLLIRLIELRIRFKWRGNQLLSGIWGNVVRRKLHKAVQKDCNNWLRMIATYRSQDSGVNNNRRGDNNGTVYAGFLVWCLYQELSIDGLKIEQVLDSIRGLKLSDGSYINEKGSDMGVTSVTSAALILRMMGGDNDLGATISWLKSRRCFNGGFTAAEGVPVADLLSTATALFALQIVGEPMDLYAAKCEEFINLHWDQSGGFFGSIADMNCDCEYTYYALLALGTI